MKRYFGTISNLLVVVLVVGAIYVKASSDDGAALFKTTDLYILIGALLALVILRMLAKHKGDGNNKTQ